MDGFQAQMNSILQNPEMMEKIMSMAQSLSQSQDENMPPKEQPTTIMPEIDLDTIQKISGILGQSNIDKNQRSLLNALSPYINSSRITKLEKAMRAAKLATLASSLLSNIGFPLSPGR